MWHNVPMKKNAAPKFCHRRWLRLKCLAMADETFSEEDARLLGGELAFGGLPGNAVLGLGELMATAEQISARGILLKLRTERGLSRPCLAAVLGVPLATLRRWEEGTRQPSGAARKLVWLLDRWLAGQPPRSLMDMATWGATSDGKLEPQADGFHKG